ncbi:MAG TPA: hypothetical protein VI362_08140 [Ignavibacteriaceae bacterium]|nr:hypothetical protein [Ignavibacteriaceae bacterium]
MQVEVVKLEEELNKLRSAVEYIESAKLSIEAASKIINTITKMKEEFEKLSNSAHLIIQKLDKIDFPARLDKLDTNINSTNQNLSDSLTRIESNERVVRDELRSTSKTILNEINDSSRNIFTEFTNQTKAIRGVQIVLVIIFSLLFALGMFSYFK